MKKREHPDFYLRKIEQIDAILKKPVQTLINIPSTYREKAEDPLVLITGNADAVYFPPWISEDFPAPTRTYFLTRAFASSTLQRIWRDRRRFPWLKDEKELKALQSKLAETFLPLSGKTDLENQLRIFSSSTFGTLNAFTASQIFYVLMGAGESKAHTGTGFVGFFAMVWSLLRRFPEGSIQGAALEPWRPTAYVTAKCLFTIELLRDICRRRARLFADLSTVMGRLEESVSKMASEKNGAVRSRLRWTFAFDLDRLSTCLADISKISITPETFQKSYKQFEKWAGAIDADSELFTIWNQVRKCIFQTILKLGETTKQVFNDAKSVVDQIDHEIIQRLNSKDSGVLRERKLPVLDTESIEYWDDQQKAASEAYAVCKNALDQISKSAEICSGLASDDVAVLIDAAKGISEVNSELSNIVSNRVRDCARWCHNVVDRERAHASAGNKTDFDPAEMVSAISVAVRWKEMTSVLEITDAVKKALEGAQSDGSWIPGQPFYLTGRVLGAWPITSDIVGMLANAVADRPEVNAADEVMQRYVDWLERTAATIYYKGEAYTGWASERYREKRRIDIWATAHAINALLTVRDIMEFRLWQLCKKRFTVSEIRDGLDKVDPVDLGARHEFRLHRRLSKMARMAEGDEFENAEYSFVLHGPPGSSKTAVVNALTTEMWRGVSVKRGARLIRITPADFTRHGESRLDSEARLIFRLLSGVRSVTILFDEIDDLLRERAREGTPNFMMLVVPAMLNRLQDLRDACKSQEICFLLSTNYIERIEPALVRKGRIDSAIPVVYPDSESRRAILGRHIVRLPPGDAGAAQLSRYTDEIVTKTEFWPWTNLDQLCKAIREKVTDGTDISDTELKDLIGAFSTGFPEDQYERRYGKRPRPQLRDEILQCRLARFEILKDYLDDTAGFTYIDRVADFARALWEMQGRKRS